LFKKYAAERYDYRNKNTPIANQIQLNESYHWN